MEYCEILIISDEVCVVIISCIFLLFLTVGCHCYMLVYIIMQ